MDRLFGAGSKLTVDKGTVARAVCSSGEGDGDRPQRRSANGVLGASPQADTVELAPSDARRIGVNPPLQPSAVLPGHRSNLTGPLGKLELEEGLMIAERHIHMTCEQAEKRAQKRSECAECGLAVRGTASFWSPHSGK